MKKSGEIRELYRHFVRKKPSKHAEFEQRQQVYRELRERDRIRRREGTPAGERIVEELRLPPDVLRGNPIVTMCGRGKLVIENYKKIVQYDEDIIRVLTGIGTVVVNGCRMHITFYSEDVLKIVGQINGVEVVK